MRGLTPDTKPRRSKTEIVCWKRDRQWIAAVEVPEELFERSNLAIHQNGMPLTQEESRQGCWRLKEACGQVLVRWIEGEVAKESKITLGEENYILFKLGRQNQNRGCRVKSPSYGQYLVMVPQSWRRDDELSGPPSVRPEPVSITGYQAHFFFLEKSNDEKIAFRMPKGELVVIGPKTP